MVLGFVFQNPKLETQDDPGSTIFPTRAFTIAIEQLETTEIAFDFGALFSGRRKNATCPKGLSFQIICVHLPFCWAKDPKKFTLFRVRFPVYRFRCSVSGLAGRFPENGFWVAGADRGSYGDSNIR